MAALYAHPVVHEAAEYITCDYLVVVRHMQYHLEEALFIPVVVGALLAHKIWD